MARGVTLATAVTRLEERFGSGVVLSGAEAEERQTGRRISLGLTSLDGLTGGGLAAGEPLALVGEPSTGTGTLALKAAAAAQAAGGEVAWLDPARSFDPLVAARCGVDLERLLLLGVAGGEVPFTAVTVARSAAFVLLVIDLGPRFAQRCAVDAIAPVVAQARAAGVATLVLAEGAASRRISSERPGRAVALPSVEVRRVGWVRHAGRIVGWRSVVARGYLSGGARLSFAPLALPPVPLVDEGREMAASVAGEAAE